MKGMVNIINTWCIYVWSSHCAKFDDSFWGIICDGQMHTQRLGVIYFKLFQSEKTNKKNQNTWLLAFKKTNQKRMNAFECGQNKNNANFQRTLPLTHRYKTEKRLNTWVTECSCCRSSWNASSQRSSLENKIARKEAVQLSSIVTFS